MANNQRRPLIDKFRSIVEHHQHAQVDGIRVDAFTAGMVVAVYDALSPEARIKFASMSVPKVIYICTKLYSKYGK